MSNIKMVIIIRKDLKNYKGEKPRTGKIIAQACHSAIGFLLRNVFENTGTLTVSLTNEQLLWIKTGQTKIVLGCNNEADLLLLDYAAKLAGLTCHLITDEGRTEFNGTTNTCIAIGPNKAEEIAKITRNLSLY